MNKKLLFAAVSLAALTACSTDDFESQNIAAEKTSPVQFEVINNNDSFTRAYMDGSNIHWEASKGDLFTLYHGGNLDGTALKGYQNATYTAVEGDGAATLTTPSMIKAGKAIMIWPVDTTFTNKGEAVAISIPETLDNIENNITYASDLVEITEDAFATNAQTAAYNKSGYNRKYPVYMRPLTSQLTLKADYAGTEEAIAALYEGTDPIDPIKVTSVDLTSENDEAFTQKIALNFTAAEDADRTRWGGVKRVNAWSHITGFAATATTSGNKLTTKVLTGNESAKFLILPRSTAEVADAPAVVVNTIYGKVATTSYLPAELNKAWYKTKGEETSVQAGMKAVFDAINIAEVKANTVVKGEPVGASATRYVKVLLKYIDMDGLHVTSDKQLYDAVRVWKELGLDNDEHKITVYLDGDSDKEFKISTKTIAKINELNAAAAKEEISRSFQVMPCTGATGHNGNTIVITGGGEIPADLTFIKKNGANTVPVALNKGENWKWNSKNVMVDATATGVSKIINRGTLVSDATATLKIMNNAATPAQVNIAFENALGATWNITAGELTVQFDVTNLGTVNISQGAEYLQDIIGENPTTFTNQALTVPERFFMKDPTKKDEQKTFKEKIGKVNNSGVFCVTGTSAHKGIINNYGRIEHQLASAKTYITSNQQGTEPNPSFATAFKETDAVNKFGLINLPWAIRESATNVSVSSALDQGFISLTYTGTSNTEELKGDIGGKVNYVIVESGIAKVGELSENIKYLEINEPGTEIVFTKSTKAPVDATPTTPRVAGKNLFDGLMVLSDVNIQQGVTITINKATFLAAKMYVGGTFTQGSWTGYYGNTTDNYTSNYRTY